jgi:hypothetical protein
MTNAGRLKHLKEWAAYVTKNTTLVFTVEEDNNPHAPEREWYTIERQKPGFNAHVQSSLDYGVALAHLEGFILGWQIACREMGKTP